MCVYICIYIWSHTPPEPPHHQSLSNLSASWKTVQFNALRVSKMGRQTAWTTRNGDKRLKYGGVPPFGYVSILCTVPQKDDMDSVQWGFNARNLWCDLNQVVFPLQRGAICPGTYFCAEEHQPCICNGEITYGPVLFDGYRHLDKPGPAAFPTIFCWLGQFQWIPFGSS